MHGTTTLWSGDGPGDGWRPVHGATTVGDGDGAVADHRRDAPPADWPRRTLDARPMLATGAGAAGAIIAAAEGLGAGEVLVLDTVDEPAVLHLLLADRGLAHRSDRLGPRHVRTEYWRR